MSSCRDISVAPQPALASGYACSSRFAITSSCDRASSARMPGFRRATAARLWFSRTARFSAVSASGTHRSRAIGGHEASEAVAGMTPTMV